MSEEWKPKVGDRVMYGHREAIVELVRPDGSFKIEMVGTGTLHGQRVHPETWYVDISDIRPIAGAPIMTATPIDWSKPIETLDGKRCERIIQDHPLKNCISVGDGITWWLDENGVGFSGKRLIRNVPDPAPPAQGEIDWGKPIELVDGRKAEYICQLAGQVNNRVVRTMSHDKYREILIQCDNNGHSGGFNQKIRNVPERFEREVWVNVYEGMGMEMYKFRDDADLAAYCAEKDGIKRIARLKPPPVAGYVGQMDE